MVEVGDIVKFLNPEFAPNHHVSYDFSVGCVHEDQAIFFLSWDSFVVPSLQMSYMGSSRSCMVHGTIHSVSFDQITRGYVSIIKKCNNINSLKLESKVE